MTSELRPALEVYHDAADAAGSPVNCDLPDCHFCQAAAAVIEADREAVRAEQAAELAKWKALAETLAGALDWYEKQANDCRKITSEGDNARYALDRDGGERARQALTSYKEQRDD